MALPSGWYGVARMPDITTHTTMPHEVFQVLHNPPSPVCCGTARNQHCWRTPPLPPPPPLPPRHPPLPSLPACVAGTQLLAPAGPCRSVRPLPAQRQRRSGRKGGHPRLQRAGWPCCWAALLLLLLCHWKRGSPGGEPAGEKLGEAMRGNVIGKGEEEGGRKEGRSGHLMRHCILSSPSVVLNRR